MDYANIASLGLTEVQETFKEVYLDTADSIPDAVPLTAQMTRTKKFKPGPEGLIFRVKLETGGTVANVPDAKLLPNPSQPHSKKGTANLSHTYTTIAVGGQSISLTASDRQAFAENLDEQMQDGMTRVRNDVERQYNGDGRGILAVVETISGAPTLGLTTPFGISLQPAGSAGTTFLLVGAEVAFINPANGATRVRTTIVDVDPDLEEAEFGDVTNVVIGDYLVLCNDAAATGTDAVTNYLGEAQGILAVCDTGTFENIDPTEAGNRRWRSPRLDAGGAILTERMIATEQTKARAVCGYKPELIYTTPGISLQMQEALSGTIRRSETRKLKGGFNGLEINGRTVIESDWCIKGGAFLLNLSEECAGMMDLAKMGYVDLDGAKLHRIEGRHAFRADLWFPHGALWFIRAAQRAILNLSDDVTIVRNG